MDPTDYSLIGGAGDGDEEKWKRLEESYGTYLCERARAIGVPQDAIDDVIQSVWMYVMLNLSDFDSRPAGRRGAFRLWLVKIVRSKSIDYFRKTQKTPGGTPIGGSTARELIEAIPTIADQEDDAGHKLEIKKLYEKYLNFVASRRGQKFVSALLALVAGTHNARELADELGMKHDAFRQAVARIKAEMRVVFGDGFEISD